MLPSNPYEFKELSYCTNGSRLIAAICFMRMDKDYCFTNSLWILPSLVLIFRK